MCHRFDISVLQDGRERNNGTKDRPRNLMEKGSCASVQLARNRKESEFRNPRFGLSAFVYHDPSPCHERIAVLETEIYYHV